MPVLNVVTQYALLTSSQISGMSASQIQALSSAQIAAITSNSQIFATNTWARNFLDKLSSSQIQAISPAAFAAPIWGFEQLSNSFYQSLTAAQIGQVGLFNLSYWGAKQMSLLSASQIKGLSFTQLQSLSTPQIQSLSSTQIAAITSNSQIFATNNWAPYFLYKLSPSQIQAISPAAFAAPIWGFEKLSNSFYQSLTAAQIGQVGLFNLSYWGAKQLSLLSASQIQALSSAQIAAITSNSQIFATNTWARNFLDKLSPSQIQAISPAAFAAPIWGFEQLSNSFYQSLTAAQIGQVGLFNLSYWGAKQMSLLSASQIKGLSFTQLQSLSTPQIQSLSSTQIAAITSNSQIFATNNWAPYFLYKLSPSQIQAISPAAFAAPIWGFEQLSNSFYQSLTAAQIGQVGLFNLSYWGAKQLSLLSTSQIQGLSAGQLQSLSTSQIQALSGAQIGSLRTSAISGLSEKHLIALAGRINTATGHASIYYLGGNAAGLSSLQIRVIAKSGGIQLLSPEAIASLSASTISGLSISEVTQLTFNANLLGALNTNAFGFIASQVVALGSAIQKLSATAIGSLSLNAFKAIVTSGQLRFLGANAAGLTPLQVAAIEGRADLTATAISSLTSAAVAKLSSLQMVNALLVQNLNANASGLTASQVSAMGVNIANLRIESISSLSGSAVGGLSEGQLKLFRSEQIAALNSEQLTVLMTKVSYEESAVGGFYISPNRYIKLIDNNFLYANISPAALAGLPEALFVRILPLCPNAQDPLTWGDDIRDIAAARSGQLLLSLTPKLMSHLTVKQLNSLGVFAEQFFKQGHPGAWSLEQIEGIPQKVLAGLSNGVEGLIPEGVLSKLDISSIAIDEMSNGFIGMLSPKQFNLIAKKIPNLTTSQFSSMSVDSLRAATGEFAKAIRSATFVQLASLTLGQIEAVKANDSIGIPNETLEQLPQYKFIAKEVSPAPLNALPFSDRDDGGVRLLQGGNSTNQGVLQAGSIVNSSARENFNNNTLWTQKNDLQYKIDKTPDGRFSYLAATQGRSFVVYLRVAILSEIARINALASKSQHLVSQQFIVSSVDGIPNPLPVSQSVNQMPELKGGDWVIKFNEGGIPGVGRKEFEIFKSFERLGLQSLGEVAEGKNANEVIVAVKDTEKLLAPLTDKSENYAFYTKNTQSSRVIGATVGLATTSYFFALKQMEDRPVQERVAMTTQFFAFQLGMGKAFTQNSKVLLGIDIVVSGLYGATLGLSTEKPAMIASTTFSLAGSLGNIYADRLRIQRLTTSADTAAAVANLLLALAPVAGAIATQYSGGDKESQVDTKIAADNLAGAIAGLAATYLMPVISYYMVKGLGRNQYTEFAVKAMPIMSMIGLSFMPQADLKKYQSKLDEAIKLANNDGNTLLNQYVYEPLLQSLYKAEPLSQAIAPASIKRATAEIARSLEANNFSKLGEMISQFEIKDWEKKSMAEDKGYLEKVAALNALGNSNEDLIIRINFNDISLRDWWIEKDKKLFVSQWAVDSNGKIVKSEVTPYDRMANSMALNMNGYFTYIFGGNSKDKVDFNAKDSASKRLFVLRRGDMTIKGVKSSDTFALDVGQVEKINSLKFEKVTNLSSSGFMYINDLSKIKTTAVELNLDELQKNNGWDFEAYYGFKNINLASDYSLKITTSGRLVYQGDKGADAIKAGSASVICVSRGSYVELTGDSSVVEVALDDVTGSQNGGSYAATGLQNKITFIGDARLSYTTNLMSATYIYGSPINSNVTGFSLIESLGKENSIKLDGSDEVREVALKGGLNKLVINGVPTASAKVYTATLDSLEASTVEVKNGKLKLNIVEHSGVESKVSIKAPGTDSSVEISKLSNMDDKSRLTIDADTYQLRDMEFSQTGTKLLINLSSSHSQILSLDFGVQENQNNILLKDLYVTDKLVRMDTQVDKLIQAMAAVVQNGASSSFNSTAGDKYYSGAQIAQQLYGK